MMDPVQVVGVSFDSGVPSVTITWSWWLIVLIVVVFALWRFVWVRYFPRQLQYLFAKKVNFKVKVGPFEFSRDIQRSYENVFIANRIYIELVTRKTVIPFDKENDVITEVYDSWYTLFTIVRTEVKNVPGDIIRTGKLTKGFIELTTKILNEGLRPHLTMYQARFRKWYKEAEADTSNKGKSPQEIQRLYPQYPELVASVGQVNEILQQYSNELHKFIHDEA